MTHRVGFVLAAWDRCRVLHSPTVLPVASPGSPMQYRSPGHWHRWGGTSASRCVSSCAPRSPPATDFRRTGQALPRPAQPAHRDPLRTVSLRRRGLHVPTKTLINWLSDSEYNDRRSYMDIIHIAYENAAVVPADPVRAHIKRGQYEVNGVVKTGDDERTRATVDAAPLRIDGSRGNRKEIEELWLAGELTDDEFEDHSSSTTSSWRTSAKAPTDGSSPAPRTPVAAHAMQSNRSPQQGDPDHEPPPRAAEVTAARRVRTDGRKRWETSWPPSARRRLRGEDEAVAQLKIRHPARIPVPGPSTWRPPRRPGEIRGRIERTASWGGSTASAGFLVAVDGRPRRGDLE